MKQKQWIALFGMVAVALILAACDGDSGNNGVETEVDSSSSVEISSSGGQINSSSVVKSSSSSVGASSTSLIVSSSSAKSQSSSSVPLSSPVVKSSSSSVEVSSSSVVVLSSSAKVQSSSSSIEYGSFIYGGQTYRTVTIGTQTWMAENLNYADSTAMPNLKGNSWCYNNSVESCAKYGRLYTWTASMNIASSYQSTIASAVISAPHQGACPAGWHIPMDAEWTTLENYVGGSDVAGTKLKSTSGWLDDGNGTDAYGFSALPTGNYYGSDFDIGSYDRWWTAEEECSTSAYDRYMYYGYTGVKTSLNGKTFGRSLRCLKD